MNEQCGASKWPCTLRVYLLVILLTVSSGIETVDTAVGRGGIGRRRTRSTALHFVDTIFLHGSPQSLQRDLLRILEEDRDKMVVHISAFISCSATFVIIFIIAVFISRSSSSLLSSSLFYYRYHLVFIIVTIMVFIIVIFSCSLWMS